MDGLAKAILQIVNNEELRSKIQKNALIRSKFYSVESAIKRWEDLISRLNKN